MTRLYWDSPVEPTVTESGEDQGLAEVVDWFRLQERMEERCGAAIRRSLYEVLDGQRTGRYRLEELSQVEKTYIGTKVEILVQAGFRLNSGDLMDYSVAGQEVDAKWSKRFGGWMIPREAVGHLCLASLRMMTTRLSRLGWFEPVTTSSGIQETKTSRDN